MRTSLADMIFSAQPLVAHHARHDPAARQCHLLRHVGRCEAETLIRGRRGGMIGGAQREAAE
jgi:hypothetical protein